MNILTKIQKSNTIKRPKLRPGYKIKVYEEIQEGNKTRVQIFEGIIIAMHNAPGAEATFTIRKIGANNIGVERIFPLHLPTIKKIEVIAKARVRRAKLYYLRQQGFGKLKFTKKADK